MILMQRRLCNPRTHAEYTSFAGGSDSGVGAVGSDSGVDGCRMLALAQECALVAKALARALVEVDNEVGADAEDGTCVCMGNMVVGENVAF